MADKTARQEYAVATSSHAIRLRAMSLAVALFLTVAASAIAWAGPFAGQARAGTTGPSDGTVVAFGADNIHQIDVPLAAQGAITAISAMGEMAMALTWEGKVIAWGDNNSGQTNVPAGLTSVKSIAAGGTFAVALKSDGSVIVWGDNSAHVKDVPAAAQSGVVGIAAGLGCVFALKSDGTIVGWGSNVYGQTTIPLIPIKIGNLTKFVPLSNLKSLSASGQVLGLTQGGTVYGWGWNNHGQAAVPSGLSGITAVSAGFTFSLALRSNGTIAAWGDNSAAQLATPCALYNFLTHQCVTPASGFTAIAAGDKHGLALKGGYIYAWGDNSSGQTTVPDYWKQGGMTQVAAGSDFSLALYGMPRVPGAPDTINASAGNKSATVNWAGMYTGGLSLLYCTITASPGGKTAVVPCDTPDKYGWVHGVIGGLTNGKAYTFTVSATNVMGTSGQSVPSNPVTPTAG